MANQNTLLGYFKCEKLASTPLGGTESGHTSGMLTSFPNKLRSRHRQELCFLSEPDHAADSRWWELESWVHQTVHRGLLPHAVEAHFLQRDGQEKRSSSQDIVGTSDDNNEAGVKEKAPPHCTDRQVGHTATMTLNEAQGIKGKTKMLRLEHVRQNMVCAMKCGVAPSQPTDEHHPTLSPSSLRCVFLSLSLRCVGVFVSLSLSSLRCVCFSLSSLSVCVCVLSLSLFPFGVCRARNRPG